MALVWMLLRTRFLWFQRDPAMSPERFFILACESVHPFWGHWPQNVLGCGRNMAYRTAFGLVCIPELECRLRPCVEVMLVLYVCNYVCMYVCMYIFPKVGFASAERGGRFDRAHPQPSAIASRYSSPP